MIIESFGVIPLKKLNEKWQVFLIQNRNGGHIGFPKGKKNDPSEDPQKAATRELKEETNLDIAKFYNVTFEENYFLFKNKKKKIVLYYLAEVSGEPKLQKEEISDGFWTDLEKSEEKVTFDQTKKTCKEVQKFMEEKR
jgi:bis(5'-nucleosidyl)-tetraphosphatase